MPVPQPPPPPGGHVPATAAARRRLQRRRRLALREWTRLPAPLVVALGLHLAVGAYYMNQLVQQALEEQPLVARVSTEEPTPPLEPEPPPEPVELEELDLVIEEPVLDLSSEPAPEADELVDVLGLGSSGLGGGGGHSASAVVGREVELPSLGTGSDPFRRFVEDLRGRGLDVALVVDATGSMQRVIDRARQALDRIVDDISTVVPDARLAVVAYRDLADDWTSRSTPLSRNHYLAHNFLADLEASGGMRDSADFEEAVEVGLAVAVEQLDWRPGSRRVIILVGDAPYHDEDRQQALGLARAFARDGHSHVDTVQVMAPYEDRPTRLALSTQEAFGDLAEAGEGDAFELLIDPDDDRSGVGTGRPAEQEALRRQIRDAVFGVEWRSEVEALLAADRDDRRRESAARHEERRDRAWFARQLLAGKTHPAIVEGVRRLFDGRLAVACLTLLEDPTAAADLRAAALYILKTRLDDVRGLPFDVEAPTAEQGQVLALIRRAVLALPLAVAWAEAAERGELDARELPRAARPPAPGGRAPGAPPPPPPGGGR